MVLRYNASEGITTEDVRRVVIDMERRVKEPAVKRDSESPREFEVRAEDEKTTQRRFLGFAQSVLLERERGWKHW